MILEPVEQLTATPAKSFTLVDAQRSFYLHFVHFRIIFLCKNKNS